MTWIWAGFILFVLLMLALALILVETTDLIFAVDSIPAIFAITADPFLVFTSNVFAIMASPSLASFPEAVSSRERVLRAPARDGVRVTDRARVAHW